MSKRHDKLKKHGIADNQTAKQKKPWSRVMAPWRSLNDRWERLLTKLPPWLSPWIRDLADVTGTVVAVIVVLKLLFGADMLVPLVVVTSSSMVHELGDNSWITWMTSRGFSTNEIESFPMADGFNIGDMIIVKDPNANLGDVIIYERDLDHLTFSTRDPIIHRVVGIAHVNDYKVGGIEGTMDCLNSTDLQGYISKVVDCQKKTSPCAYTRYPQDGVFRFYITKGDNNDGADQCNPRLNISYPVTDAQVTGRALLRLPYLGWPKLLMNVLYRIITLQF